ncbi:MAG: trypsin-like peptidase domain-containing protein [Nannocystis sp.]|nr:serine protease [Nannocystis sp.]MBA3550017.1 trypsin-like peptidase domain-containing protein [Nannocystis sp.]
MPRLPRRASPWLLALALALTGCAGRSRLGGVNLEQGSERQELSTLAIAQKGAAAVGVLSTDVGRGLAFVVDPDGYLLTNRHVVEDADYIDNLTFPALQPARRFASVRIVYIDPLRDLALIKVEVDEPLPYLPLATGSPRPIHSYLHHDDDVLLLTRVAEDSPEEQDGRGNGSKPGFVARTGKVRELEVFNQAVGPGTFFGLTQNVKRGMSGGPVLDRHGRAVGVVSWTWKHRIGGYAIPIAEATQMLAERPLLATSAQQATRASDRAHSFVDAVHGGRLEIARRMLSPTYARKIRSYTMRTIAEQMPGEGKLPVQQFVAALEDVVLSQPSGAEKLPFDAVQDVVLRTGTTSFMRALGVDGVLSKEQVISFFFEFAQAYVSARFFADIEADAAMDVALARLQTVDAARTFAFAEVAQRLSTGDDIAVEKVDMIPGEYAPQAVVHLRVTGKPGQEAAASTPAPRQQLIMQLRLEWGDWYIAELQSVGLETPVAG